MLDLYFFFLGLLAVAAEVASFPTAGADDNQYIAAAVLGESVTFECRPEVKFPAVDWRFQSTPDENEVQLCKDGYLVNGYAKTFKFASDAAGEFDLVIPAVSRNSSGLYTCVEEAGLGECHKTEFVVFASPPICSTNLSQNGHVKDFNTFQIQCNATYYGNCEPNFKCQPESEGESVTQQRTPLHYISYRKMVTASPAIDGVSFKCSLVFECRDKSVTNIQLYQYTWSSPVVHVASTVTNSKSDDDGAASLYAAIAFAIVFGVAVIILVGVVICLVRKQKMILHHQRQHLNHHNAIGELRNSGPAQYELIMDVCDSTCLWGKGPLEVIEILLMKAFIGFFNHEFKTPEAKKTAFVTLCSVSYSWWNTFRGWPQSDTSLWFKRTLHRHLKYLYKPYCCSPQLVARLPTTSWVCGIAHLKDRTFVVSSNSDRVLVFDEQYNHQSDIMVKGLRKPQGIVASQDTQNLYVSDSLMNHIWQITPDGVVSICVIFDVDQHGAKSKSRMASISSRRLLVILPPSKLVVYGLDNGDRTHVNLPSRMDVQHAVETAEQTYVISHFRPGAVETHEISEVDSGGGVIRSFGYKRGSNPEQLDSPAHVLLDGKGHILVADMFNNRVLVLNSQLKLQRILLAEKEGLAKPHFLCFNDAQGHLLVGEWLTPTVKVFCVVK